MKNFLAMSVVLASSAVAHAGGIAGSVGVGAEAQLSGLRGLSINYDADKFHVGGFLGLDDQRGPDNTRFDVGGRFYYHVGTTASSDFGVGGGLGIESTYVAPAERRTYLFLEPGFQIRMFVVPNVALSFTGGFSIGAADASSLEIDGDITGGAGVHYYF